MSTALPWFKSTDSSDESGQCLEVAYTWRKSSYSSSEGGQCLEVAFASDDFGTDRAVHIRDSKNPTGPIFTVSPEAWAAFTDYATR